MTPTVQEEARERAAQQLARRVAQITALADPLAWARAFIADMTEAGGWRYVPPAPNVIAATRDGTPPNDDWLAAKAAITRKDDPDA